MKVSNCSLSFRIPIKVLADSFKSPAWDSNVVSLVNFIGPAKLLRSGLVKQYNCKTGPLRRQGHDYADSVIDAALA